jgi:septum formation protein
MATSPPVLLASGSTYRQALLKRILAHFDCVAPDIDEARSADEAPSTSALRLAGLKAAVCAKSRPDAIVIGSDQVPALGPDSFGKPGTHERAVEQLRKCSGQSVIFYTAVSVVGPDGKPVESHTDQTTVRFRSLSDDEIEAYLRAEKPYDCAGSFKAESLGITLFESIESADPTAIQGLPLIWLCDCLRRRGITFF